MKEQDAAHSFEKKYKNKPDVIRIIDNLNAENADLKAELTRLRSELQQARDKARNQAIQDCIDIVNRTQFEIGYSPIKELEQLKTKP